MMLGGTAYCRGNARWIVFIIILPLVIALLPGAVAQDPTPTVSHINDPFQSVSLYYGAGASVNDHWIETSLLFRNQDPNATTVFLMLPDDPETVYNNGSAANGIGWYVRLRIFNSTGSLHTDLGYFTNATAVGKGWLYLDPLEVYTLQARLHVPEDLVVGRGYESKILITCDVPDDPQHSGAQYAQSFIFKTTVNPTLSYFLGGRVYQEGGWVPASSAKVVLTNLRTSDSIILLTDSQGRYDYDLMQLPGGYMDNDVISVKATSGDSKGKNATSVNIVTTPVLGIYGRDCDIFLVEEEEEPSFWELYGQWILILVIIILVILVVVVRSRTRGKGGTDREKDLQSTLSASKKEIKSLKRTVTRRDAELGRTAKTWAEIKPEDDEEPEPEVEEKPKPPRKKAPVKKKAPEPSKKKPAKKRRPVTPPVVPAAARKKKVEEPPEEEEDYSPDDELPEEVEFEMPDWLEKKITPEADTVATKEIEEQPWLEPDESEPEDAVKTGFEAPAWLESEMASVPDDKDTEFESQPWLEPEEELEPEDVITGAAEPEDLVEEDLPEPEEPGFDDLLEGDLDDLELDDDEDLSELDLDFEDLDELGPLMVEEADADDPDDDGASVDREFGEKAKDIENLLEELD